MKYKRIILIGKGASGKDYAKNILKKHGYKIMVNHTTRPKRPNEVDGIDYFFISEKEFLKLIDKDYFYEYDYFYNWYYGTSNKQFNSSEVYAITPSGLQHITKKGDRNSSFVIFFDISENIRYERLSKRKDSDTPERRIDSDNKTFIGYNDYDIKITDPNFTEEYLLDLINKKLF